MSTSEVAQGSTETHHTPGPWTLDDERNAHVISPIYHTIDAGKGYHPKGFCLSGHMSPADARLIAAAPDLLALAKQYASECAECHGSGVVSRQIGGDGYGGRCAAIADVEVECSECEDIRKVIAKAEGRP